MNEAPSRVATQHVVRTVLAADCAYPESAFLQDGLLVIPAEVQAGRRRYPLPAKQLLIITTDVGVVVSCHPDWITSLRSTLADLPRNAIFSAPTITNLVRFVARQGEETSRSPASTAHPWPAGYAPVSMPSRWC